MTQPHNMHENSLDAYFAEREKLSKRCTEILDHLEAHPRAWTDREIKRNLNYDDMNMVRPRITELLKIGLLIEVGKTICSATNKSVRTVKHCKYVDQSKPQMEMFL